MDAREKALELLKFLKMEERAYGMPEELSGGEQQRVAIARALITNPKLILADEPTGALDPITSREVLKLFKKLHEERDVAFLLVHTIEKLPHLQTDLSNLEIEDLWPSMVKALILEI